jgi:hypothetical protein
VKRNITINWEGRTKIFFSFSLLIYSVVVTILTKSIFALPAMLCATCGDILIMSYRDVFSTKKDEDFVQGIVAFALSHFFYLLAMRGKYESEIITSGIIILLIIVLLFIIVTKGRSQAISFPYALILLLNVFNAWHFSLIAGIGATLFLMSDSILSIGEKKNAQGISWQWAIWCTYVPAQALLLTAILIK